MGRANTTTNNTELRLSKSQSYALASERRGGSCARCGYSKSVAALSFHHKDPSQKEFGLSNSGVTHSWDTYWEEAQKCELLCAICHAELHEEEGYIL